MTNNNNPFCSRNRHLGPSTSDLMKGERNTKIAKSNLRYFRNKINNAIIDDEIWTGSSILMDNSMSKEDYNKLVKAHNECAEFLRGSPHSIFHKDHFPTKKGTRIKET